MVNNVITDANVVQLTQKWIDIFVVGLKLCPFAPPVIKNKTAHYAVFRDEKLSVFKSFFEEECARLMNTDSIETSLIITPENFLDFDAYLNVLERANKWIEKWNYEGIFQIASFHPDYQFENTDYDDNENFTNRSPFPVFQILREKSITEAAKTFKNIDSIGEQNAERFKAMDFKTILQYHDSIKQNRNTQNDIKR